MSSLPARAFKNGNHSSMGSSVFTTQNQGGGNKKAGFPYQVGQTSWTPIYRQRTSNVLFLLRKTTNPRTNSSRPIGSTPNNNHYYHIPGAGK